MPLLLTPAAPLRTTCFVEVPALYVIINAVAFNRLARSASFELAYYANEACSLPGSGAAQVAANLPLGYSLTMTPAQAAQVGNPEEVLEAYAAHELGLLLPGAIIETVA